MSTNISKKKRDDLLDKIKQIRAFIAAAPQDENTGNLLSYLSELEKDVNGKKYGLVFEEHREEIDEVLDTHTPVLTEDADLFIDHGGQMNFLLEGDISIVYGDNSEKQKLFYPDYIVGISGEIWIIETKGGFDRSGNSQDIDIYTPKKFEVLKAYLDAHGLKGGIVRNDATTDELCICMEHYSDDIGSDDWVLLEEII